LGGGAVAVLEDFRRLDLVRNGRRQTSRSRWQQDKGHQGEWEAFAASIRGSQPPPISLEEIVATTLATLKIAESETSGRALDVDPAGFIQAASGLPFSKRPEH